MSILFAIIIFSFLIFIHELGHFVAAKLSGVQVNEFSVFMGPAIWKKQKGETLYAIRCIPIGGYCAMEGEDFDTNNPRSFQKAAWWKRFLILFAGAAMNFIVGVLIVVLLYLPSQAFILPEIAKVEPQSALAGTIQEGDRILKIDGERVFIQSDFSMILALNGGDIHDLTIERAGERILLQNVNMEKRLFSGDGETAEPRYGINFTIKPASFGDKLSYGWNSVCSMIQTVKLSLQMLLSGKAGLKDMTGPVGIVQIMSETAQKSPSVLDAVLNMLYFGAFIAINLAIMNLLPIPALDGGRIVSLLITTAVEAVIRRKINPKYEGYIHGAGMILLLGLMAVILFKDIFTIFKG